MNSSIRLAPAVLKATAGLGLSALLVAGCASSKSTPAAAPASSVAAPAATLTSAAALAPAAAPASTAAAPAAAAASSPAAPAAPATVAVKTGPLGAYLVDATGRTLYLFTEDKTTSTCYGKCGAAWAPLLTGGAPQAGAGATASLLATTPRTGGSTQVTYNGHPLYYFEADKAAGDTNGQGKFKTWWMVAPAGKQIGSAPAAGATASPTPAKTSASAAAGGGWS
jgi:predicted lipoprotein with Yx(FWY)xxD motif